MRLLRCTSVKSFAIFSALMLPMAVTEAVKVNVFLVGGQSNADGRAPQYDLPPQLQLPQDDVAIHWAIANNGSTTLKNSGYSLLRPGFSNSSGSFGPEVTFGRAMADFYAQRGESVALIKHAQGGTGLVTEWQAGGDSTTNGDGFVYSLFQQVVTSGMANIQSAYLPGGEEPTEVSLAGMIWMQGERDSNTSSHAAAYEANLTEFIGDIRATYGAELPFVIGQLSANQTGTNGTDADRELVRSSQAAVANALPHIGLVVTDTFGLKSDNLHFDASGQQSLGYGFAEQMQALLPAPAGANSASFDFGMTGGQFEQQGWTSFHLPSSIASPHTSEADPDTGWTVTLTNPTGEGDTDADIGARQRDPLDASIGGTFTLDDVYVDFIVGFETLSINHLDPSKRYNVQLIMYDDSISDGRSQSVFNMTNGDNALLGTSVGPGSGGGNLVSDLDNSVFGNRLSPDANGDLIFRFTNTSTGDRSLVNGLVISVAEPALAGDFNDDGIVTIADYVVWRNNLGADESTLPPGSHNNSGTVDLGDYNVWTSHFGSGVSSSISSGTTIVPEARSLCMLLVSCLAVVLHSPGSSSRRPSSRLSVGATANIP